MVHPTVVPLQFQEPLESPPGFVEDIGNAIAGFGDGKLSIGELTGLTLIKIEEECGTHGLVCCDVFDLKISSPCLAHECYFWIVRPVSKLIDHDCLACRMSMQPECPGQPNSHSLQKPPVNEPKSPCHSDALPRTHRTFLERYNSFTTSDIFVNMLEDFRRR